MPKKTVVLVVEDEQMLRDMYAETLRLKDFSVLTAEDSVEALEQLKRHSYDQ